MFLLASLTARLSDSLSAAVTLLMVCCLLPATNLSAKTVFKAVDENGSITFTDSPDIKDRVKPVELPPVMTIEFPKPNSNAIPQPENMKPKALYQSVNILSPAHNSTLNNPEVVQLTIQSNPKLRAGHYYEVSHNGQRLEKRTQGKLFLVPSVYRGSHTFVAYIVNASGKILEQSETTTLHVKKNSVLHPNPNNQSNAQTAQPQSRGLLRFFR